MALATTKTTADWLDQNEFPFEPKFLSVKGGSMHYVDEGSGSPIVFVHGNGTWSFMFRRMIRDLSLKHRAIAPDHIGFGLSSKPHDFSYTPEEQAANFEALMRHLDLAGVHLVLHEYGGPIALQWALKNPERVASLTIINSWMWSVREEPAFRRWQGATDGALARLTNAAINSMGREFVDRLKLTDRIHDQYKKPFAKLGERGGIHGLAHGLTASSTWFAGLWAQHRVLSEKPMLLLWGMKDKVFDEQVLARWTRAFPHAQVEKLAQCGHFVPEECANEAEAALYLFLDGRKELNRVSSGVFGMD